MGKGDGHRNWANAHHKAMMQKKRKRGWMPKGDPIVLMLSSAFVFFVAASVFFWPRASISSDGSATGSSFSCRVMSITDGDTLRCWDGTRVRLHAVAARESDETCSLGHPCPSASGASATAKLSELASGQTLQCQQTGTSYNRVTAICQTEANLEINCAMVESGTTLVWPKFNEQRAICGGTY